MVKVAGVSLPCSIFHANSRPKKGRLILIFWAIPPPRNFAKIRTRGGRGLQPEQPKDSIPPLGSRRNAAGAARRLCRSQAGSGALAAVCLGGRGAGGVSPGRCGQGAVSGSAAGASGARGAGAFLPSSGGKPGAGKMAAPSAACVGFQATSAIEAAGGRKSPFLPYKEALFSGRGSCQIRAVLRPNPCRFGRVAFSAAQSDECVTPGGAGEKPRRKTKRPSERSTPHEKPDFRYRD